MAVSLLIAGIPFAADAADAPATQPAESPKNTPHASDAPAPRQIDIYEYRVEGTHLLPQIEVEGAVYPFLGPGRSTEDVEKARAALEKAYNAKGYQTVAVEIPPQQVKDGVVILKVVEGKVKRLQVKGSHYYSLDAIKEQAPSLAEGTVPNFNAVANDIVALNQQPDRRVTPALRAGSTPGTVDVDLNVEDTLPLHGSLELNNRQSANTTPLRLNGSLHYDNLWQLGHSLSLSFQVAPENVNDAKVLSGSYLARVPDVSWLSFLLYGVLQDSNVSTLGSIDVVGRGDIIGIRSVIALPSETDFFHSLSMGIDYKHFDEVVALGNGSITTPVTYYPLNATYSATWAGTEAQTQLNAGVTFHLRGFGSNQEEIDAKRTGASGDFLYLRGDLSHTRELPLGLQIYGKVQGQLADQPLVSNEQFGGGGLDTVRGYLESEVLGDNGLLATIELRSPSIVGWLSDKPADAAVNEWRVYLFTDGGAISVNDPLSEQQAEFNLASVGVGSRLKMLDHFNGSLDLGVPMITQSSTHAHDPRLNFRLWAEF